MGGQPGLRPRLGSFLLGGRRVACATVGSGPPLVCDLSRLHHLDVFWRYAPYRRLVEALAREFTVVCWDRPGCGLSDREGADFTVEAEVALFDRLVEALDLGEPTVLASGSAAPAMIAVAARRPERVRRLALFTAGGRPWRVAREHREAVEALLRTGSALGTEVLARWAAAGCDAGAVSWLAGAYRQSASGAVIAEWLRESAALDVRAVAGQVRCPALLLYRRGDRLIDLQEARDLAAGMPDALLVPVDGGESLVWEGRDVVLRPLLRFLTDGRDARGAEAGPALTRREREVADLVADGLTNAEIGSHLGIGHRTIESHLERLRAKLGLETRADLAAWVARRGMGPGRADAG